MAAVVGIERRLAHQPVHAGLGLEPAVGVIALDAERWRDLMPATSPPLTSISSVFQPRDSHQRRYMRSRISAQSCASVPPAPAWMSTKAVGRVHLAGEHALELELLHVLGVALDVVDHRQRGVLVVFHLGQFEQFVGADQAVGQFADAVDESSRAASVRGPAPARVRRRSRYRGFPARGLLLRDVRPCRRSQRYPLSASSRPWRSAMRWRTGLSSIMGCRSVADTKPVIVGRSRPAAMFAIAIAVPTSCSPRLGRTRPTPARGGSPPVVPPPRRASRLAPAGRRCARARAAPRRPSRRTRWHSAARLAAPWPSSSLRCRSPTTRQASTANSPSNSGSGKPCPHGPAVAQRFGAGGDRIRPPTVRHR